MYNSSDIFCLKEPKTGENDGSQMFSSMHGTGPMMKIPRRHQISNSVFQFGGSPAPEVTDETEFPEVVVEVEAPENENEIGDVPDGDAKEINEMSDEEIGDLAELKEALSEVEASEFDKNEIPEPLDDDAINISKNLKNTDVEKWLEADTTTSNMSRNLVTGFGLEEDQTSSRKHFQRRGEKGNCFRTSESDNEPLNSTQNCKNSDVEKWLESGKSPTTSNMTRSLVTGVGLEEDRPTSRKHFQRRGEIEAEGSESGNDSLNLSENFKNTDVEKWLESDEPATSSSISRNLVTGVGLEEDHLTFRKHFQIKGEIEAEGSESGNESLNLSENLKNSDVEKWLESDEPATTSSMTRSFLTGVGLEEEQPTYRKHFQRKGEKSDW